MPPIEDVMVPMPFGVTVRVYKVMVNVAVTDISRVSAREHGPFPEQSPVQPANVAPPMGVAVSVMDAPEIYECVHVPGQEIPTGAEVTVPEPPPCTCVLSA